MRGCCASVFLSLFTLGAICHGQSNSWRGLTPLRSTRADVEKLYGKAVRSYGSSAEYVTQNGKVRIRFAQRPCESGWNVQGDTVIEITAYDISGKTDKELGFVEGRHRRNTDDVADHYTWFDPEQGLEYYFVQGIRDEHILPLLESITYGPKRSDTRCDGFPPYAPERDYFTMDQNSFLRPGMGREAALNDVLGHLDELMIRVQLNEPEYAGYVVIYFDRRRPFAYYKKELVRLKTLIKRKRKVYAEKLVIIEGGLLDRAEFRLYMLPKDWPPPAPVPEFQAPNLCVLQVPIVRQFRSPENPLDAIRLELMHLRPRACFTANGLILAPMRLFRFRRTQGMRVFERFSVTARALQLGFSGGLQNTHEFK